MRAFHFIYKFLGSAFCRFCLCYWVVRDFFSPPKEESILFVAHPDDDTLFFHTFIKENKPYVVLLTAGWSLRRLPCFFKAMKHYGIKYRAYDMGTRDKRVGLLEKHVKSSFSMGNFKFCATHNAQGEYGHEMHRRVHQVVLKCSQVPVFTPVDSDLLDKYPLDDATIAEKKFIFNSYYTTEKWVLDQYSHWVVNEKLELYTL
ncbi:MAG: hypothetical protein IKH19_02275 [Muribaculaceae bacterium]|nr:hypothetical protein [Muribaculaceae bacterium]